MSVGGRVVAAVAIVGGALALWQIRSVLLLVLGGLLFAIVFSAATRGVQRLTRWPRRVSFVLTVLALAAASVAVLWWVGGELAAQLRDLRQQLPGALDSLRQWLAGTALGSQAIEAIDGLQQWEVPWMRLAGAATLTLGALGNFILMLLLGVFIALEPSVYQRGIVRLVPVVHRPRLSAALEAAAAAQAAGPAWPGVGTRPMLFVGVATWVGLALLDVPLALILGVLAGILGFIPFFGAIVSGALAVLLAFTQGPQTALYVALIALAIQQVEGNLLMPLVQRWAVQLPPAVGVVSVVVAGGLFGIGGVLLATPLVVVLMVLVRKLYVEGLLEGETAPPEDAEAART